jgi:hypothetical protein
MPPVVGAVAAGGGAAAGAVSARATRSADEGVERAGDGLDALALARVAGGVGT